jgi:hypothetical protein
MMSSYDKFNAAATRRNREYAAMATRIFYDSAIATLSCTLSLAPNSRGSGVRDLD